MFIKVLLLYWGRRVIGISGSLIWSKNLMELIFNPCDEFRWSPESPVSQIQSLHLHAGVPWIFSDLLRSVQMLKREWDTKSNGKLLHLFNHWQNYSLVPAFTVKDLHSAKLQPKFLRLQWTLLLWRLMMMLMMVILKHYLLIYLSRIYLFVYLSENFFRHTLSWAVNKSHSSGSGVKLLFG